MYCVNQITCICCNGWKGMHVTGDTHWNLSQCTPITFCALHSQAIELKWKDDIVERPTCTKLMLLISAMINNLDRYSIHLQESKQNRQI